MFSKIKKVKEKNKICPKCDQLIEWEYEIWEGETHHFPFCSNIDCSNFSVIELALENDENWPKIG